MYLCAKQNTSRKKSCIKSNKTPLLVHCLNIICNHNQHYAKLIDNHHTTRQKNLLKNTYIFSLQQKRPVFFDVGRQVSPFHYDGQLVMKCDKGRCEGHFSSSHSSPNHILFSPCFFFDGNCCSF